MMKLIVGLGNPGREYAPTRHNVGRQLVQYLASRERLSFSPHKKLCASTAFFEWEGHAVTLAFPEVFMNLSGQAVSALVHFHRIDPQKNLLILVDDLSLPFGRLRLRPQGSAGGHNGLKSIEEKLKTSHYSRLRLGIGAGLKKVENMEEYVLSPFGTAEKKKLPDFLAKGFDACRLWVTEPMARAMNAVNPKD
jgi:PTH1 family peptidyl-tRNA hydrolase